MEKTYQIIYDSDKKLKPSRRHVIKILANITGRAGARVPEWVDWKYGNFDKYTWNESKLVKIGKKLLNYYLDCEAAPTVIKDQIGPDGVIILRNDGKSTKWEDFFFWGFSFDEPVYDTGTTYELVWENFDGEGHSKVVTYIDYEEGGFGWDWYGDGGRGFPYRETKLKELADIAKNSYSAEQLKNFKFERDDGNSDSPTNGKSVLVTDFLKYGSWQAAYDKENALFESILKERGDLKYKANIGKNKWLKGNSFVKKEQDADTFESKTEPTQRINQMKKDGKINKNAVINTKELKEAYQTNKTKFFERLLKV